MSETAETETAREAAIKRLKQRREFGQNIVAYVVINAFLTGIWFFTGRGYFWPAWVLAGWGIGIALHGWTLFGQKPITEADIQRDATPRRRLTLHTTGVG